MNPAQVRLLEAWLGNNDDLCVVGDPDQAIYSWNGSDPRALLDFPQRHPGSLVVRLAVKYRSTDAVQAVASSVLTGQPSLSRGVRPASVVDTLNARKGDTSPVPAYPRSGGHGATNSRVRDRRRRGVGCCDLIATGRSRARRRQASPSWLAQTPSWSFSSASWKLREFPSEAGAVARFLPVQGSGGPWIA